MAFFDLTNDVDAVTLNLEQVNSGATVYKLGDSVRALDGDDTVTGSDAEDDINGNRGDDVIFGAGGNDFLRGGQGNDLVQGDGGNEEVNGNNGNDTLNGDEGNDILRGGKDDDSLNGGGGDDTLYGDFGANILTGGVGSDTFVLQYNKGTDTITDFRVNEDAFAIVSGEFNIDNLNVFDSGSDTVITDKISGQTIAVVKGVDSKTISSEIGFSTTNFDLPLRLRISAQSNKATVGLTNLPSLTPVNAWTRLGGGGEGWSASGVLDINSGNIVFSTYVPIRSALPETITLTIDTSLLGLGTVGFEEANYGYQLFNDSDIVSDISVPIVLNSNLTTTTITFSDKPLAPLPLLN
ncbi:calcium-binding protein [Pseudanabaena sp. PCC 6802]|uniref:calcium-binding protein n=1 Tax=Pseudanabaena sp. PCC 6802 TaxID=118173 RepID=UPI000347A3F6|nr:calcium-binding protein [Pseudanabaena sp. PCC 6802]